MALNFDSLIYGNMTQHAKKIASYFNGNSQELFYFLKKYMENNPEKSNKDVLDYMDIYLERIKEEILMYYMSGKTSIMLSTCKQLLYNKEKMRIIYDSLIAEERKNGIKISADNSYIFRSDENANRRFIVAKTVEAMREDEELSCEENSDGTRSLNKKYGKTEFEMLIIVLQTYISNIETKLKKTIIENLQIIGRNLEQLGTLDRKFALYSNFLDSFGLSEIKSQMDSSRSLYKQIFGDDVLNNFSIDALSAISMYWMNQFAKQVESICYTSFAIKKLNLVEDIRNAKINPKTNKIMLECDFDRISVLIEKALICRRVLKYCIDEVFNGNNVQNKIQIYKKNEQISDLDIDEELDRIFSDYSEAYKKYFKSIEPDGEHDLADDFELTNSISNVVLNLYDRKDYEVEDFLYNAINSGFADNWGIILETEASDLSKSKYIIIGVDLNGINMPIRLHFERETLLKYLKETKKGYYLPLYEGSNDFISNGRVITTQILIPSTKGQTKFLTKKAVNESDERTRNLIEHLLYLADNKHYPEHLKVEKTFEIVDKTKKGGKSNKGKKNKGTVSRTITRKIRTSPRLIDIETGLIYTKDQNGKYVLCNLQEKSFIEQRTESGFEP